MKGIKFILSVPRVRQISRLEARREAAQRGAETRRNKKNNEERAASRSEGEIRCVS